MMDIYVNVYTALSKSQTWWRYTNSDPAVRQWLLILVLHSKHQEGLPDFSRGSMQSALRHDASSQTQSEDIAVMVSNIC